MFGQFLTGPFTSIYGKRIESIEYAVTWRYDFPPVIIASRSNCFIATSSLRERWPVVRSHRSAHNLCVPQSARAPSCKRAFCGLSDLRNRNRIRQVERSGIPHVPTRYRSMKQ